MAVFDQGGGGGKAGADATDLALILSKPYELNGLTQETLDQINQMFEELYRTLRQTTQIDTQTLIGRYGAGNGNQQAVSLGTGLALSSAGVLSSTASATIKPTLLNQFWYGWQTNWNTTSSNPIQAIGTVDPASDNSTGTISTSWSHAFTIPYTNQTLSAAQTIAFSVGLLPATTVLGGIRRNQGITADFFVGTGTPTGGAGHKYWIGIFNQRTRPTLSSDTAPTTDFAAFRFSTAVPDTNWQAVTRDGSATTVTDMGVAVTTDTAYHLKIRMTSSAAFFSINGGSETQVTANLPTGTSELWPQLHVWKDTTGAGQLVDMYFNRMVFRVGTPGELT